MTVRLMSCNIFVSLLMTVLFAAPDANAKVYYEQRLLTKLLKDYNPRARPVGHPDDVINVTITFHLTKVVSLNTKEQILQTSGWLQLIWTDSRLTWDPNNYGEIKLIALLPTDVWFPNFALENSAGAFHDFNHHRLFRISARYDGLMIWEPAGPFQTFCPLDVTFYPFDTQTCALKFVDWVYSDGKVRLELGSEEIYTDQTYYQQTGEWRIQKTSSKWESVQYEGNETFSRVSFIVVIHRQYIHYFVNLLFPSFILSFLVLLVYFVPRNMGEKLGMGITLMMSYFVFNLTVAEDIPKSAESTPIIQVYLVFYMSTTALTIAVSVMTLWLNHTRHVAPPPEWLRFIVYHIFARIICYGKICTANLRFKNRTKEDEEILENQMKREKEQIPTGIAATTLVELANFASATAALEKDLHEAPSATPTRSRSLDYDSPDGKKMGFIDKDTSDIKASLAAIERKSKDVMGKLFNAVAREEKAKSIDRIKEEWTEITKVINAFSFCVLFTVTIVFIIMCGILWIIVD